MQQIAVRAMHFDDPPARGEHAPGRRTERVDDRMDAVEIELGRRLISISERDRTWPDNRRPAAVRDRQRTASLERAAGAGLAAGVGELHAGRGAVFGREPENSRQHLDVGVFPDPQIVGADSALRSDGRRFGQHRRGAANRTAAQVHEMPVARETVATRVPDTSATR